MTSSDSNLAWVAFVFVAPFHLVGGSSSGPCNVSGCQGSSLAALESCARHGKLAWPQWRGAAAGDVLAVACV
jgi:hypothetical protein